MLFIFTSYTANIVALLQSTSNDINTLEDLLHSNIELGADDTPYQRFWVPQVPGPTQQLIYKQKLAPSDDNERYFSTEEGIRRVRNEFFAFHIEFSPAYKLIEETFYEHEKCGMKEIDYLRIWAPWFVLQKNSPYKELIKIA